MHHNLFILRRENRKTQKEMAAVLNIHHHSYHLKECGKVDFSLTEAINLAKYFDTTLDELFKS